MSDKKTKPSPKGRRSPMGQWVRIMDDITKPGGVKTHWVCPELYTLLLADLTKRFGPLPHQGKKRECTVFMDMPGMVHKDRPIEKFTLGSTGLAVEVPSEDVAAILEQIADVDVRRFGDADRTRYYKLHNAYHCFVLTPKQYTLLVKLMRAGVEGAEQRAKAFWAQHESPAAAAHGIPLAQVGDLGGHKVDRHLPRVVGRA